MRKNLLSTPYNYKNGRCMACTALLVMIARNAYTQTAGLWRIQNSLQGYAFYNIWKVIFEATGCPEQRYAVQSQLTFHGIGVIVAVLHGAGKQIVVR